MTVETIDHNTLRHLVEAGAVRHATAVAFGDTWTVVVHYGRAERTLRAKNRRAVRHFRHLDTLARYLRDLGLPRFETDATNYDPNHKTLRRPDRAEALKRAHAAAGHDQWFLSEVQQALHELNTGEAKLISHEDVKSAWARRRTELLQEAEARGLKD
jgi:hypothetical protein